MPQQQQQTTQISNRFSNAFNLLKGGYYSIFIEEFLKRVYSESLSFGLQRDLDTHFEAPKARIRISIRSLRREDVDKILESTPENPINPRITTNQRTMVNANFKSCYVVENIDEEPCYLQWLIGYSENEKLLEHFGGIFPRLNKGEALLEGAFSKPEFRGLGIMPSAMAQIAEKGITISARWIKTYVNVTNIASLKGCKRSGFTPFILRKDRWFLFQRKISFHSIPKKLLETYYRDTREKIQKKKTEEIKHRLNGSRKVVEEV